MVRRFGGALVLVFGVALLSAGCAKPTTAHVSGKVYQANGKPLPGGTVIFYPTEGATKHSSAEIQEDGSYDLPAAPTGKVKIAVNNLHLKEGIAAPIGLGGPSTPKMPKGMKGKGMKPPPKDAGGPPKEVGKEGAPEGAKTAPDTKRYVAIDAKYADPEKSGLTYEVKPGAQSYEIKLPK